MFLCIIFNIYIYGILDYKKKIGIMIQYFSLLYLD